MRTYIPKKLKGTIKTSSTPVRKEKVSCAFNWDLGAIAFGETEQPRKTKEWSHIEIHPLPNNRIKVSLKPKK